MVYLIVDELNNICKIGSGENPKSRLKTLQTANVNVLKLRNVIEGELHDELEIHKKFEYLRLRGEWFTLTQDIIYFFENFETFKNNQPILKKNTTIKIQESNNFIIDNRFMEIISNLTGNELKILIYLISFSKNNHIVVTKALKESIVADMIKFGNTTLQTVANTLSSLVKKEILTNNSRGSYLINPKYFGGLDASTTNLINDIFTANEVEEIEDVNFENDNPYNKPSEQLELELNDFNNLLNN